jgi:hypothetical protein
VTIGDIAAHLTRQQVPFRISAKLWLDKARMLAGPRSLDDAADESDHRARTRVFARSCKLRLIVIPWAIGSSSRVTILQAKPPDLNSYQWEHYEVDSIGYVQDNNKEFPMLKYISIALFASATLLAIPAAAEEVGVGVGVGPVGAGVTVGSGPDRVVREKEVIREREPRDKVIIKKERAPTVVEKKTIIKDRD